MKKTYDLLQQAQEKEWSDYVLDQEERGLEINADRARFESNVALSFLSDEIDLLRAGHMQLAAQVQGALAKLTASQNPRRMTLDELTHEFRQALEALHAEGPQGRQVISKDALELLLDAVIKFEQHLK